jgi:hypothetical protein
VNVTLAAAVGRAEHLTSLARLLGPEDERYQEFVELARVATHVAACNVQVAKGRPLAR